MSRSIGAVVVCVIGLSGAVSAGPISVFTQVSSSSRGTDEIDVGGVGTRALLTTGGGVNPLVTVAADQTSARQMTVGFWPVMNFRDVAQYEEQQGREVVIPDTPVKLHTEVYNGDYTTTFNPQILSIDAVVSGRISPTKGGNQIDWRFAEPVQQVRFDDAVVTLRFDPVAMPDGLPHIGFEDSSPPIGWPGPVYYPTLIEVSVEVDRAPFWMPDDPVFPTDEEERENAVPGTGNPSQTPEPASVVLLAGFALGGVVWLRQR